jgi:FeS assembly SUF system regulator
MVRISKLTDYAVVIMAYIAEVSFRNPSHLLQAREIAQHKHLNLPTVSKLLKSLAKHQFLNSLRGANGGYQLAIAADQISILDLIQAIEGPFAITECNLGHEHCSSETQCAIRTPWLHINEIITKSLSAVKLSDLTKQSPGSKHFAQAGMLQKTLPTDKPPVDRTNSNRKIKLYVTPMQEIRHDV